MRIATVMYYEESDGWWAEAPDFPSFFAAGDTYEATKDQVRHAIYRVADEPHLGVRHMRVCPRASAVESPKGTMERELTGLTDEQRQPKPGLVLVE